MSREELVSLKNVQLRRGQRLLGRPITFSIGRGEAVLLVGDNGTGKSTFCEVLVGEIRPASGTLWTRKNTRIVLIPQGPLLFSSLDVAEHMALGSLLEARGILRSAHNRSDREPVSSIDGAIFRALSPLYTRKAGHLSIGERQLLKLALGYTVQADVVILDEPLAGFDVDGGAWVAAAIGEHKARGRAVIVSSHEPELLVGIDFEETIDLGD